MGLFDYNVNNPIILVCMSFLLGLITSFCITNSKTPTSNMKKSMAILPALVCTALLTVNGSLGISITIMGIFGLVRFQSAERSSSDIIHVFLAMVIGLISSTGYVFTSIVMTLIIIAMICVVNVLIPSTENTYLLKIIFVENCDFEMILRPILEKHFSYFKVITCKAINDARMEISYHVTPKKTMKLKDVIDEIKECNNHQAVAYSQYTHTNI